MQIILMNLSCYPKTFNAASDEDVSLQNSKLYVEHHSKVVKNCAVHLSGEVHPIIQTYFHLFPILNRENTYIHVPFSLHISIWQHIWKHDKVILFPKGQEYWSQKLTGFHAASIWSVIKRCNESNQRKLFSDRYLLKKLLMKFSWREKRTGNLFRLCIIKALHSYNDTAQQHILIYKTCDK